MRTWANGPPMGLASTPFALGWLAVLIVLAPLLSGGWRLDVLPVLLTLAGFGWIGVFLYRCRERCRLIVPLMALVLGGLSVFTALQAIPLGELLWVVSPRAAEVRAFVAPEQRMSITYEVGATWREAAKMMLYALTVALAHEVARRRGARPVLIPVVVAGCATVVAAALHKLFHIEPLWGVFEGLRRTESLATTFQNANHASSFLTLSALTAAGLGVDAERTLDRAVFLGAAALLAGASVVEPSKGGVLALGVGLLLFGALIWRRSGERNERVGISVLFAALLLPLVGVVWRLDAVVREFGLGEEAAPLGLVEKLAAMQNAWPIVADHLWAGIGRGAYVSVYPHYQTSPLQLTFAFPENIVAQLTSEWGLPLGGLAFGGLAYAVAGRLARVRKPYEIGASAAVAAVLVHDLVDFSMEMPGVALSCAAILGALAPRRRAVKLELRGGTRGGALAALPVLLAALFTYGSFRAGDLQSNLAWLSSHGLKVAEGRSVDHEQVRNRAFPHPANVLVATQVAYIREVQRPPDLRAALASVNRALYLGPRYADAHVLAGRLLLRAGHRRQAFAELREAWRLTGGRQEIVATARRWARSVDELIQTVPRSDPVLDVVDAVHLCRLVMLSVSAGDAARAKDMLDALPPLETLEADALEVVARAALVAQAPDLALAAARRGAELRPGDAALELTLAKLALRTNQLEEARKLVHAIDDTALDPKELFGFRLRLALTQEDYDEAREALTELRRRLPVTRENQKALALREAELHSAEGRPDRAVGVLGRAVDWAPADIEVRLVRARALVRLGRRAEARVDAEFVLRRDPKHAAALALLRRLSVSD